MRRALTLAAMAAAAMTLGSTAHAADLPKPPDLSGLTTTVDGVAQQAAGVAGDAGHNVVDKAAPAAGRAVSETQRTAGETTGSAARLLGQSAGSVF
jgi:hypothetical protein